MKASLKLIMNTQRLKQLTKTDIRPGGEKLANKPIVYVSRSTSTTYDRSYTGE